MLSFLGHRKRSQHYHEPIRPLVKEKKSRKKSAKVPKEKKPEKEKIVAKSPQKFPPIKVLPPLAEDKELTQEQISDHEVEAVVWPKVGFIFCIFMDKSLSI